MISIFKKTNVLSINSEIIMVNSYKFVIFGFITLFEIKEDYDVDDYDDHPKKIGFDV